MPLQRSVLLPVARSAKQSREHEERARAREERERLARARQPRSQQPVVHLVARLFEWLDPRERAVVEQAAPAPLRFDEVDDDDPDPTQPIRVPERELLIMRGLVSPAVPTAPLKNASPPRGPALEGRQSQERKRPAPWWQRTTAERIDALLREK